MRWLRILGLASLSGLVAYFIGLSHLALNHLTSPLLTYGVWALVWIVTAAAVMALVSLWYNDEWKVPDSQFVEESVATAERRLTRVEMIALAGAVSGTIMLLLIVTYWGVFLGI